jgi:hypothetical protein
MYCQAVAKETSGQITLGSCELRNAGANLTKLDRYFATTHYLAPTSDKETKPDFAAAEESKHAPS